ncbi:exported hypothetical protein [Verrucomicrobia bacterium]|nr:exported hypothetical protein [Verrucomicrobiota bacterium]
MFMKLRPLLCMTKMAFTVAGCASNRGGTAEEYSTGYDQSAPPPFGPGLNSQNILNPNALTTPEPHLLSPPNALVKRTNCKPSLHLRERG